MSNQATTLKQEFSASFDSVVNLMEEGVAEEIFPGAVILVAKRGEVLLQRAFGNKSVQQKNQEAPLVMSVDTVFDIASLTAVLATTTLMMKLVEGQKIKLEDRVARYIQSFGVFGKSAITIEHLLIHASGLPAWLPFFEDLAKANAGARLGILTSRGARDYVFNAINRLPLKHEPGSRQTYSDIDFIILGELIEGLTGLSIDRAVYRYILQPLSIKSTSYIDLSMIKRRGIHPVTDMIAPTEECPWRGRVLCGEVHDDNAWAMGGIAGHSGLFSTAFDLHQIARELILAYHGDSQFLSRETVRKFWSVPSETMSPHFRYGWESPSKENGMIDMIDSKLSQNGVGHCGFTGCSLWIEPELGIEIILMTNRVNPSRSNKRIVNFRPKLHDAVLESLSHVG